MNIKTSFCRVCCSGWKSFRRNSVLSVAAIFILILTVLSATAIFTIHDFSGILVRNIEDRVDITVEFHLNAPEESILETQEVVNKMEGVRQVEYLSSDDALERFIAHNRDNYAFMQTLTEVGNPFPASFNIKADNLDTYNEVVIFLEDQEIVDSIDYDIKENVLDKVFAMTSFIQKSVIVLAIVLGFASIIIVLNTILLALYNRREEIAVMRLMGTPRWFIEGAFLVQGALIGFVSSIIAFILTIIIFTATSSRVANYLYDFSLIEYFTANLWTILLIQIITGIGLGVVASLIAVRGHLKK
jgi:cell division transport system permease protein